MKVYHNKSAHTTFNLRHGHCPNVSINNIPIPPLNAVKYLGLILDQKLTWNNHIKTKILILETRSRSLKTFLSKNNLTNLKTKLLIYKTLLKPIWTYGLQLWGSAKKQTK